MGSKLAGSLGALPIFGARTLRYERRALSRRKFTIRWMAGDAEDVEIVDYH